MTINKEIHKESILNNDDFLEIIKYFNSDGVVIDDRGRNVIKTFKVKGLIINVKSFKIPNIVNQVAYKYIRDSKAKRSYKYANILIEKNILTPQPFAYYEYFSKLGLKHSYYFSNHLKYDLTYRELKSKPKYPDFENILRQFTQFTFKLHENGIYFKDHSPGNTLIVKIDKKYDFYLIDLNRMNFLELDLNARIKNFSRLTEEKDMVKIMSDEYAKLIHKPFEYIYKKMWNETKAFRKKYNKKARLKEKYLGRKSTDQK